MIYAPQSSPGLGRLPACAGWLFLLVVPVLRAQEVREISVATRLLKEPEGIALVSLPAGTSVEPRRTRGNWREVVIEGWIFSRSTEKTSREGFDLVVTPAAGENIRKSPNGAVAGRVRTGTLLNKEEVRGAWTRVRRAGWVPREAVKPPVRQADPPRRAEPDPAVPSSERLTEPVESGALPLQAAVPSPPDEAATEPVGAQVVRETAIFAAPQAGSYGTLQPGAAARVLSRSGDWTKVQFEGWVRESNLKGGAPASLGGVTAAEVRADPTRYIGQTVDWRVELIAVQEADDLRAEMARGQPYLLTRGPLPEPGFVYVTVTDSQATEFRSLQALQELTLRVTIRAPRTRFLSTPVVELISRVVE